jgi:Zn-dependent protease/CBS domain-containing protein
MENRQAAPVRVNPRPIFEGDIMRGSWRTGRIMGIDITVDVSWFLIAFLLIYTLGFLQFPRELHPRVFAPRADVTSVGLGIAACLLIFASVLAHELSHSWMAIQRGIPVTRITLFIFGGVAQIANEPDRPITEFLIAIMGPLMSLTLAALFGAVWIWTQIIDSTRLFGSLLAPIIILSSLLAQINAQLALFNLAPGFPLDGGRVLRAILWGITHNIRRATWWAARAGQLIALLLIGVGAWLFLAQFNGGGIWFALIGFFLWNAAGEGYRQTDLLETLRGVTVSQLMTREFQTVSPNLTLTEFVDQHLLPKRDQTFAVSNDSDFEGLIGIDHVRRVPRPQWNMQRVRDAMTPRAAMETLSPDQPAAVAMTKLSSTDATELPVIEAGRLAGFLGRAELSRFLRLKPESKRA